ncbi:Protein NRT1/ PTR FAMILY 3.1 [Camellia lanceoleosa]|uniref:Protein NRT1/ PTR FAMILY 3.1 n=1 Tax=Camellia lanceoleosa TaxID=1840588 RepID=A0ACC0FR75_9ERIC|nr:Protein NRT1/ PTR FAMILY 3.1 [Camellia lanceoleosa]
MRPTYACNSNTAQPQSMLASENGMVSLTLSAILPQLRPPPCPTQESCQEASSLQLWVLYLSLFLLSAGAGGLRPNVITFAADQFDMTKSKVESRSWNFFNWYFFTMGLSTLISVTVLVYVQDNVGWGLGFGIPTIVMAFSTLVYILGTPLYKKVKPGGSPLVRLVQVVVAAWKKRKEVEPEDPGMLYQSKELDALISSNGRLLHTDQFKWLDRVAILTEDDAKETNFPNLWRLATVHRVEELKSIIQVLPIWVSGILLIASHANQGTFGILQAHSMDRRLFHSHSFQIPPASMSIFSILTILVGLVLYDRLFVPFARRFTRNPAGITCLQRMGIGFMFYIVATIVSALIEMKRKAVAAEHNLLDQPNAVIPISVFWLLPQHCIYGIVDVFMSVGHMEFLYDQSPKSMRSFAAALYWIAIVVGQYMGTLMVSLVHKYTGKERNWLPDRNLNRGRLENYFWLATGVQVINLMYYVVCA